MIGIVNNSITVRQLYDYALKHNYVDADAKLILDIINQEKESSVVLKKNNNIINNIPDFNTLVEYSVDDLLILFST